MDNDELLPVTLEGYSGNETERIQRAKFMKMGFTYQEFDRFWALVQQADMITPWPSEETFDDIYRMYRSIWRPQKPIAEILAAIETVLDGMKLR